jgi:hypothetical protein
MPKFRDQFRVLTSDKVPSGISSDRDMACFLITGDFETAIEVAESTAKRDNLYCEVQQLVHRFVSMGGNYWCGISGFQGEEQLFNDGPLPSFLIRI